MLFRLSLICINEAKQLAKLLPLFSESESTILNSAYKTIFMKWLPLFLV